MNNYEKMRSACERVRRLLMLRGDGMARCVLTWDEFNESQKMLREVLSAPPRNCDVGTAKDQTERFEAFCQSNMQFHTDMFGHDAEGRLDGWDCREDCPVGRMIDSETAVSDRCQLAWAQMPYEGEEGAKAEAQMDADGGDNKEMRHE